MPNDIQTILILSERENAVLPHSSRALETSIGLKRGVCARNIGNIIIYKSGECRIIKEITFLRFRGHSLSSKIISCINGLVREIYVKTQPLYGIEFSYVRLLVANALSLRPETLDYYCMSEDTLKIVSDIERSKNMQDIFDALGPPNPNDCIDFLSSRPFF